MIEGEVSPVGEVGIVSYGAYVPHFRITPDEIGKVWGVDGKAMGKGLMITSKSVPSPDEDTVTIAVEAARNMMSRSAVDPKEIGALYVGSESHPYAVKPTGTIVAEAIEAAPNLTVADFEFACKAGTAAIQTCMGLVGSGMVRYAVAVGADTSQGAPGDALEYSASAGGAAFLIGKEKVIASIDTTYSYTTDTPDFWRREGQLYPRHGGRFTGEPAYFKHVLNGGKGLLEKTETKPTDFAYAVFHQPNGKFPTRVAKQLGFKEEQVRAGMLVSQIGNTYSGAVPLGLAAILDEANPGDRIFAVAYGSGAGSDAFDITVTDEMSRYPKDRAPTLRQLMANPKYLDYATYAKFKGKIVRGRD
ncbi:MAG: hydroxymethylglutaryl-CoA synthase [Methanobacteriota archaeon]|nr:MAG: hydroxymethylglutaryl-CoA synthase [Euryarchaeota archaeon]